MAEKTIRHQQRSLVFSIADPVVSKRIDIQIDVEPVDGEPNTCDWVIRWRTSDSSAKVVERLYEALVELSGPKPIWTDKLWSFKSRPKGSRGDGGR